MSRPWPKSTNRCVACGVGRDSPYGGRGLCVTCYGRARRDGSLEDYTRIGRTRGVPINQAGMLILHMGLTWSAETLRVKKSTFKKWAESDPPASRSEELRRWLRIVVAPSQEEREMLFNYNDNPAKWLAVFKESRDDE